MSIASAGHDCNVTLAGFHRNTIDRERVGVSAWEREKERERERRRRRRGVSGDGLS